MQSHVIYYVFKHKESSVSFCILLSYWKQELERKALGRKARLWMVLAKSFKWRFFVQAILAFIEV